MLSRETGQPVLTGDGTRVGKVVDMTVRLDVSHPLIHRLGIGSGRHLRHLVPWTLVMAFDEREVRLNVPGPALDEYTVDDRDPALEDGELLLCRDVLDTEVVDLAGRRLSRVSDVFVVHRPDSRLEVAAVDVGVGSLLRRMGLGPVGSFLEPVAVDWDDLHLTSGRGHVVQLATATTGMHRLDDRGLAELLARLSTGKATDVIRTLGPARSARALHESHPVLRRRLLHSLTADEAQEVIDAAPPSAAGHLAETRHPSNAPRRRLLRTAGWRVHRPPGHPPVSPERGSRP